MKICIIGQGYIGIPTAALFSKNECNVIGVDINKKIVEDLNKGIVPIEEPKIQEIMTLAINDGFYKAKLIPESADAYIITVPTPYIKEDYDCDLSYVISACESILPYIKKGNVIIIESTVAPLSMDTIIKPIFEKKGFKIGTDLYLAHCPERVLPGKIIYELVNNNRIVGGITPNCSKKAKEIYEIFVKGEIIQTEAKTAELSKCMENTFRDVNIALSNELVKICSKVGINALDVIKLANKHPRVNLHTPGPGVGGHCLAIDPYFIYSKAPDTAKIIKLSRDTNVSMPIFVVNHVSNILHNLNNNLNNTKIVVLGLSYKGNTDDDRESPSYEVISKLQGKYTVAKYDPHIQNETKSTFKKAITGASMILILTDHQEFKDLDYDLIKNNMKYPILFDTKQIIKSTKIPEGITLINFGNLYKFI